MNREDHQDRLQLSNQGFPKTRDLVNYKEHHPKKVNLRALFQKARKYHLYLKIWYVKAVFQNLLGLKTLL